jgi:hypothetical protein
VSAKNEGKSVMWRIGEIIVEQRKRAEARSKEKHFEAEKGVERRMKRGGLSETDALFSLQSEPSRADQ